MVGCAFVASWTVSASTQLKRINGASTLAQLQLILGSLLAVPNGIETGTETSKIIN